MEANPEVAEARRAVACRKDARLCCWHDAEVRHLKPGHLDLKCCWCGRERCVDLEADKSHGPHVAVFRAPGSRGAPRRGHRRRANI